LPRFCSLRFQKDLIILIHFINCRWVLRPTDGMDAVPTKEFLSV
jgi:hypothetical protein